MKLDLQYWEELDHQIPGWMSKEEAEFLVENVQGDTYLEIGVAFGKSIRLIKHHFPEMSILGIDLINHGVDKKVEGVGIIYANSNQYFEMIKDLSLDTIFIDGDHTYKGALSDFVHWYNKVAIGGKIIFHDYGRNTKEHIGVTQAVDAIKPLLRDFHYANCIAAGTK